MMTKYEDNKKVYLYPYCVFCGELTSDIAKYPIKTSKRLPNIGATKRWQDFTSLVPFAAHKKCMRRYSWVKIGVTGFAIIYALSILPHLISIGNKPIGPIINIGGYYIFGIPILLYAIWYFFYHNPLLLAAKKSQATSLLLKHLFESKEDRGYYQYLEESSHLRWFSTEDLMNEVGKLFGSEGKFVADKVVSYAKSREDSPPILLPSSNAPQYTIPTSKKSPALAAVLSLFFFGGAGQLYLGQWKKGLTLIGVTLFLTIVLMGIPFVIIGVLDAYGTAQKLNNREKVIEGKLNVNWKVTGLLILLYIVCLTIYLSLN